MKTSVVRDLPHVEIAEKDVIIHFLSSLRRVTPIDRVILFGSRARGEHRANSDTDILISLPMGSEEHLELSRWFAFLEELNQAAQADVSISLVFDWDNPELEEARDMKKRVEQQGIVLTDDWKEGMRCFVSRLDPSGIG